jgi:hypothetical protein
VNMKPKRLHHYWMTAYEASERINWSWNLAKPCQMEEFVILLLHILSIFPSPPPLYPPLLIVCLGRALFTSRYNRVLGILWTWRLLIDTHFWFNSWPIQCKVNFELSELRVATQRSHGVTSEINSINGNNYTRLCLYDLHI